MSIKNKINFEQNQDSIAEWLNTNKTYRLNKRERYFEYLRDLRAMYPQFNNPTTQLLMSYTQFVNLIAKNAVVATIIMILAVGGTTTVAAQFFAPEKYKPSNLLNSVKTENSKPTVTNFEECMKASGVLIKTFPGQCIWENKTFVEEISETVIPEDPNFAEDSYKDWQTVLNEEYGIQLKYSQNFVANNVNLKPGNGTTIIAYIQEKSAEINGSGAIDKSLYITATKDSSDSLINYSKKYFEDAKTSCLSWAPEKCNSTLDYSLTKVAGGEILTIKNPQPSPTVSPFKIMFAKSDYSKNIFSINAQTNFAELGKILTSISFFAPNGISTTELKTYTNAAYPGFQVQYPSDWTVEVENDSVYPQVIKSLRFRKNDFVLNYPFVNGRGTGITHQTCTNNTNLFLGIENGYVRTRQNDGNRIYTTGRYNAKYDRSSLKQYGMTEAEINSASSKWIETFSPEGSETFGYCANLTIKSIGTGLVNKDFENSEVISTLMPIRIEGANNRDVNLTQEADKIVASTKF